MKRKGLRFCLQLGLAALGKRPVYLIAEIVITLINAFFLRMFLTNIYPRSNLEKRWLSKKVAADIANT